MQDICNAIVEIQPGKEATGPRSQFDIYLILSIASSEVSSSDIASFNTKQVSPGNMVLYSFSYTAKGRLHQLLSRKVVLTRFINMKLLKTLN